MQFSNKQKTNFIIKSMESCVNMEQLEVCVEWIARIGFKLNWTLDHLDCADELTSKYYEIRYKLKGDKNC